MKPQTNKRNPLFAPLLVLAIREIIRFYRQPSRIIGALVSPLIFWFLLGSGLGNSLRLGADSQSYLEYFFPGTLALVILFTSIFSTISIIEDRREGFLQSVLVAPLSRMAVVGGKVLGGTAIAFFQGLLLLVLAPLIGISLTGEGTLLALVTMFLLSLSLTSLGFVFAWQLDSVQGFHGVMNVVLFPMWFLSGALFPFSGAPAWLKALMLLNPMTYGVDELRRALDPRFLDRGSSIPFASWSLPITLAFGILFYAMSTVAVMRRQRENRA